jgi:hypothetical protein
MPPAISVFHFLQSNSISLGRWDARAVMISRKLVLPLGQIHEY